MKKYRYLIVIMLMLLLVGCGDTNKNDVKEESNSNSNNEVEKNPNAVILKQDNYRLTVDKGDDWEYKCDVENICSIFDNESNISIQLTLSIEDESNYEVTRSMSSKRHIESFKDFTLKNGYVGYSFDNTSSYVGAVKLDTTDNKKVVKLAYTIYSLDDSEKNFKRVYDEYLVPVLLENMKLNK